MTSAQLHWKEEGKEAAKAINISFLFSHVRRGQREKAFVTGHLKDTPLQQLHQNRTWLRPRKAQLHHFLSPIFLLPDSLQTCPCRRGNLAFQVQPPTAPSSGARGNLPHGSGLGTGRGVLHLLSIPTLIPTHRYYILKKTLEELFLFLKSWKIVSHSLPLASHFVLDKVIHRFVRVLTQVLNSTCIFLASRDWWKCI